MVSATSTTSRVYSALAIAIVLSLYLQGCGDNSADEGVIETDSMGTTTLMTTTTMTTTTTTTTPVMNGDLMFPQTYSGDVMTLASYIGPGYTGASGVAEMDLSAVGVTTKITVSGATSMADKTFNAHLHALPCASDGGGHYMNDPRGGVDGVNENWPILSCDSNGVCSGTASNAWSPLESAVAKGLSIVVHDTPNNGGSGSGPKMFCADLMPPQTYSGNVMMLPSYSGSGYAGASGVAEMDVSAVGVTTKITMFGAISMAGKTFNAHLHALPCAHYMNDPSGGVNGENENWPILRCDSNGVCSGTASNAWSPLESALAMGLSIVVHDTPNNGGSGSGQKMFCADLILPQTYSGNVMTLASYSGPSNSGMTGVAKMDVSAVGVTTKITVSGATSMAGKTFNAHLHALPCASDGGGHYMNDPSGGVDDLNENWPILSCDSNGMCVGMASNAWSPLESAIASGLSIVVHDTPNNGGSGSGPKMFCADLMPPRKYMASYSGVMTWMTLASYSGPGYTGASGVAEMDVSAVGVTTRITVSGTTSMAGKTFNAHLHALPCASDGGGHYMNDARGGVDDVNENWPILSCDSKGVCFGKASNAWSPLESAIASGLSIVVHDTPNNGGSGSGPKMFCADLRPPQKYFGSKQETSAQSPTDPSNGLVSR